MDRLVNVLAVELLDDAAGELRGSTLEWPKPDGGGQSGTGSYDLDIRGWVVGHRLRVVQLELDEGDFQRRYPLDVKRPDVAERFPDAEGAEESGFSLTISTLTFPPDFEFVLRAVLRGRKTVVDIARIRGRRAPLRSRFKPRLRPVMINTLGRSGSTALARLLHPHPQIVAYRPLDYEPRVATYWIEVMRALAQPTSYRLQVTPGTVQGPWWVGPEWPVTPQGDDADTFEWMGREGAEALATFCQSRIDAFYERYAQLAGRPDAVYFTEKFRVLTVPPLMWEIYEGAREIVLVRDFRDMICSMLAFNAKQRAHGMPAREHSSEVDYIRAIGVGVRRLAQSWQRRAERAHLLRYEDLVLHPTEALEGLLGYLELDASEETRSAMLSSLSEQSAGLDFHRTTDSSESSIGRWRRDLSEDLQGPVEEEFGPALTALGYEL
jgi:hypothetical protein